MRRLPSIGWFAVLTLAIASAGCAGSDGSAGPPGPQGPQGQQGQQGDTGPAGVPASATANVEVCAGCHAGTLPDRHALVDPMRVKVTVDPATAVTIAANGTDILLRFNVKVDGVNRNDFLNKAAVFANHVEDAWWVYDVASTAGLRTKIQPANWTLTGNGAGNYTATLTGLATATMTGGDGTVYPAAAPGTVFHVGVEGPNGMVANAVGYFPTQYGNAAANVRSHDVVSNQACANCHGTFIWRAAAHDTTHAEGVDLCTICHNRSGAGDPRMAGFGVGLMSFAHGIHNSKNMPGGSYTPYWSGNPLAPISVGFPGYMDNCATCHDSASRLAAVTSEPMSWDLCTSCHGTAYFGTAPASHQNFSKTRDCQTCHPGATVNDFHNGLKTERAGLIWDGADQSVVQGKLVKLDITGVGFDAGGTTTLAITWTAGLDPTGAGTLFNAIDPCNASLGSGPVFFGLTANAATGQASSNLSILRAYAIGNDWVNGLTNVTSPGQPGSSVSVRSSNTTCAGNVATTKVPVETTAPAATRAVVSLQGKPQIRFDPAIGTSTEVIQIRSVSPTREFVPATGALPSVARRPIVDSKKCVACHLGSLYQHGGDRVDSVPLCVICHNPASSEQQNRVAFGLTTATAYDGRKGQTYDLRAMVHDIHAAGENQRPLVIYRTRGVFAFGPTGGDSLIPHWPPKDAGTPTPVVCKNSEGAIATYYKVYGSVATGNKPGVDGSGNCTTGSASTDGTWLTHTYTEVHYPQPLNNCVACHVSMPTLPDQTQAVAVTDDAGAAPWSNQLDDVLMGPAQASCITCHQSNDPGVQYLLRQHANDGGWQPRVFTNGRQDLLNAVP